MNRIVDDRIGRFGAEVGRWIALHMTTKLLTNMIKAMKFPKKSDVLLQSENGNCYIVWL